MTTNQYLSEVREQYEEFPYPARDPNDEKSRLVRTCIDDLAMINHYCFAGRESFRDRFRVLVAGGGTGDATIFLAEQLRHTNAEIVHLDISQAAIDIARKRAQMVALENISWVHQSILALPALGLGKFHYINCSGVLHHLEDPDEGLRALLAVLNDAGALGVMVYGKYGRTGVYQMQSLLRLVNEGTPDMPGKIRNAREVLDCVPQTNWFKRGEELFNDHKFGGDGAIYDLLLHSHDRAYSVGELYEWLHDQHGLHLEFTVAFRGRSAYVPSLAVAPKQPPFLDIVRSLPLRRQYEIAELITGSLKLHTFYVTRSADGVAPYGVVEHVPYFINGPTGHQLSALVRQHESKPFMVDDAPSAVAGMLDPGRFGADIVSYIDGKKDFGEIFAAVRAEPKFQAAPPTDDELFQDFRAFFDFLTTFDRLLLRHRTVELPGRDL